MTNIKTTSDTVGMGKAYWKSLIVQQLMYASPILNYTRKNINKIQIIENGVYRFLMHMAGYTTNAALRGEMGASKFLTRAIEARLMFIKGTLESGNQLVNKTLKEERGRSTWNKIMNGYLKTTKLKYEDLI